MYTENDVQFKPSIVIPCVDRNDMTLCQYTPKWNSLIGNDNLDIKLIEIGSSTLYRPKSFHLTFVRDETYLILPYRIRVIRDH
jgi:hypothetical protein